MEKIPVKAKLEAAQCLLVNYVADSYKLLLKKIIGLLPLMPASLRMLVVPLPKGATHVDQYFAKRIQRIVAASDDHALLIMFIPHESHQAVLKNFYKVTKTDVLPVDTEVTLKSCLSERTLLYAWGSAAHGKLGTGVASATECEDHSEFVRGDLGRSFEDSQDRSSNQYYTYCPQPVVSFLGTKMRSVVAGKHHCLALTTAGDLYAWGDNSQCQLGLDPDNLVPVTSPDGATPAKADSEEEGDEIGYELDDQPGAEKPSLGYDGRPGSASPANRKKNAALYKKVLKMAKIPYRVRTEEASDYGPKEDQKGKGSEAQANRYELVACGDYNSYAVLNI